MKSPKDHKPGPDGTGQGTKPIHEESLKYQQEGKKRQRPTEVLPGGGEEHKERQKKAPGKRQKVKIKEKRGDLTQKMRKRPRIRPFSG